MKFVIVHEWNQLYDGVHPCSRVYQATDGAMYVTTYGGGAKNMGVVYRMCRFGFGDVIHHFRGEDGAFPSAGVIQGKDGALYGTTRKGGAHNRGVVYKVNDDGTNYQVLHSFAGEDGVHPSAGVIQGSDGALYGTTMLGGAFKYGVVYRLNPDGTDFQVLHNFEGEDTDGAFPEAGLIQASDGALYGTAPEGCGRGVLYRINLDGSGYQILHRFARGQGSNPHDGVIQGSDGALYGTTANSDMQVLGVVYKVNLDGSGYQILHRFGEGTDNGAHPGACVIQASDGALYGTTRHGGARAHGVIYKVSPDGSGFEVLHSFETKMLSWHQPMPGVIQASDGALYGTVPEGGLYEKGAFYRLVLD